MSANRIVATLTPLAAVLAGATADWLARHAPGAEVAPAALEEIYLAGMAAVVAPAVVWLLGWQKHEAREAAAAERAERLDLAAAAAAPRPAPGEAAPADPGLLEELEALAGLADLENDLAELAAHDPRRPVG